MTDLRAITEVEAAVLRERIGQGAAMIRSAADDLHQTTLKGLGLYLEGAAREADAIGWAVGGRHGYSGICRYCSCTMYDPCGEGCSWADADETECTSCVEGEAVR